MKYLNEGEQIEVKGSGKNPYIVKKSGGVVSCSCPAWRNLGGPIDNRVCKHIKANIDPACLLPQAQSTLGNAFTNTTAQNQAALKALGVMVDGAKSAAAPPCLLAYSYTDEDPTGWWMSEKLDGVRAWWDGEKFISRLGNVYHAPKSFLEKMPVGVVLDGELFAGRGKFQQTVSTVRKLVPDETEWSLIRYVVFDAPEHAGTFEERLKFLATLDDIYVEVLPQYECRGRDHLAQALENVIQAGGEGMMLREPGSQYEAGRSHTLLKVKRFYDAEAVVVGHEPGKGKHKGRMGAIKVQMEDGKTFSVGSGFTDKERENPPGLGTKITYKYQELTKDGIPRFPTFVSARDYE